MYEIAPLLDDPIHNLKTIRDLYRWAVTELETSDLSFGHGSPSALEDASFLICRALKLPFENFDMFSMLRSPTTSSCESCISSTAVCMTRRPPPIS